MGLNFTNKIFNIGGEGTPTLQFCKGGFIIGGKKDAPSQGSWQVPAQTNLTYDDAQTMITAFGSNKYVAIAHDGDVSTSTDGLTWSTFVETALTSSGIWTSIAYGNNKFVAAGYDNQGQSPTIYISTSMDGITWTSANMINPLFVALDRVLLTYTGQEFVILGGLVDMATMSINWAISTSTDGITWTTPNVTNLPLFAPPTNMLGWNSLIYGNGKFVIFGANVSDGLIYISTSTDGITWTTPQIVLNGKTLNDISLCSLVYDNSNFILLFGDFNDKNFYSITSTDGITWTEPVIETSLGDTETYTNLSFQTFNNTNFVCPMLNWNDKYWYITTYKN